MSLTLDLATRHGEGQIRFQGEQWPVTREDRRVRLRGRSLARGLEELVIDWRGAGPLIVRNVALDVN